MIRRETLFMARRDSDRDDWSEDDEGEDRSDDNATVPCPFCGREIYDDAELCPYCKNYISLEEAPRSRKPLWIIVGAIVCLYAVLHGMIWMMINGF